MRCDDIMVRNSGNEQKGYDEQIPHNMKDEQAFQDVKTRLNAIGLRGCRDCEDARYKLNKEPKRYKQGTQSFAMQDVEDVEKLIFISLFLLV